MHNGAYAENYGPADQQARWELWQAAWESALSAQPSPGGQDALDCIGRIEEAIEFRVPHDIYAAVHGELAELKAALAGRQPVRIYGCCAQPEGELHTAECPNMRHLAAHQPVGEPVEISPDFTDTARAAIAWVLWHHQGGSSPVGQPLRFALGMEQHDRMTDQQIAEAKRFAAWAGVNSEGFHHRSTAQAVDLAQEPMFYIQDTRQFVGNCPVWWGPNGSGTSPGWMKLAATRSRKPSSRTAAGRPTFRGPVRRLKR